MRTTGHPTFPGAQPLLVGREREQSTLRDHLATAIAGRGSLVLIGGEAGIGKTALAELVCREAEHQGLRGLVGHCYDLTETPPYGPWVELFGHYQQAGTLPPHPAAFARRGTIGEVTSQAALLQQVLEFLTDLSAQWPVVLLLDDLHWADPASLDLLRFLAQSAQTLPLLMLGTYRVDELTRRHPLYALLPTLVREAHADRLDLRRLTENALRELIGVRYRLGPADAARLIAYLQERAEGNPFFLGELLRTLEEEGTLHRTNDGWVVGDLRQVRISALLRQVIDGRLARLGEEAQGLLSIAAVIGQEVPLGLWGLAAGVDEETLLAAVERAAEAHLLVETPDGLNARFAHALTREAVYEGISPARRRRLHRQIAELLAALPQADPDAVAHHFQRAADSRAVPWLVKAGERAQLAYAWFTAIERYEAALSVLEGKEDDIAQQGWLRYRIARLRRWSTPEQGVEYLDVALRIADRAGDAALAAAARFTRGLCLNYAGGGGAIEEMIAGADALEALSPEEQARLDLLPDDQGIPVVTNPRGMLIWSLATAGRLAEALAMGEATHEGKPRHTPLGELGWAHHGDRYAGLGITYALVGQLDAAREVFTRGRDTFGELDNQSTFAGISSLELQCLSLPYFTDRLDEHWRLAEMAAAAWDRASTLSQRYSRLAMIPVLALTGQWTQARSEAEAAIRVGQGRGWGDMAAPSLTELAHRQGEPDVVWTVIHDLLPSGPRTPLGKPVLPIGLPLLRLAATLCLDEGDLGGAKEWLETHDGWLASSGAVLGQSEGQALWSRYNRQSGNADQAFAHAQAALIHASEPRQPLAVLAAHRLLGTLDTDAARFDQAREHLDQSLVLADACHAPYERALTLLALAELRAATNEIAVARAMVDEVLAICEPLEAKPTLARASALATRLAVTVIPQATFPGGLSAREVDVLRLIATGLNNQEIADALSISVRTVERHITNLYAKIDVRGRADATAYALHHLT